MYISIIGTFIHKYQDEAVYDTSYWMIYESDDVDAVTTDFTKVLDDLQPRVVEYLKSEGYEDHYLPIYYEISHVEKLQKLPHMWKDRKVQKL